MQIYWIIPPTVPYADVAKRIDTGEGEVFQTIVPPLGFLSLAGALYEHNHIMID